MFCLEHSPGVRADLANEGRIELNDSIVHQQ